MQIKRGRNAYGNADDHPGKPYTGTGDDGSYRIHCDAGTSSFAHRKCRIGKMQAIINMDTVSTQQLLQLNQSVEHMINAAARLETVLQAKLELSNQECNINEEEEVDS